MSLLDGGLSYAAVARETGLLPQTVRNWRVKGRPARGLWEESYEGWRPPDPDAYSYLLGLYLGDGCIAGHPRGAPGLEIKLDAAYPQIIVEAISAMRTTARDAPVRRRKAPGAVVVHSYHPVWPHALPQHGPGRKHLREIKLVDWQLELTHRHPQQLIRGLIHSDGSRVVNRFKTKLPSGRVAEYQYVRYFFTNYSADIRRIFCDHCDLLGIRWTQSSFKNISVARRDSVSLLDSFVGPKG
jgi:hypothetical protein